MKKILLILFILSKSSLWSSTHPELENFPPPKEGYTQVAIVLEEKPNEEEFQVELFVGRTLVTDVVNVKKLGGSIRELPVKGWGYTYYVAEQGPVITTLMASRPGKKAVERFVSMPGKMIRYNSRLPIVVHVPERMEVRYRIWNAGELQKPPPQS